jgi:hypothetical protein
MVASVVTIVAVILTLIGWIWGVVLGFQKGGALWGILNILLSPITPLIMAFQKKMRWTPVVMQLVGIVLSIVGPMVLVGSMATQG